MADLESLITSYVTQRQRAYAQGTRGIATPEARAAWETEARDALAAHDAEVEARVRGEVAEAAFKVDGIHHFHAIRDQRPVCLCGFVGNARARTQTEHITSALVRLARGEAS